MQRVPYIAVTYYMGRQLISSVYRNCPLNLHCATFEGITEKPLAFLPAKQQKQRPGVAATYQGEQWEPMLRFSSIGKADMQLCLPVPPQRERRRPIQPGTGNTCECADARGMFLLCAGRLCLSHGMLSGMAVFAYVAPEWLCLTHTYGLERPQFCPLFDM